MKLSINLIIKLWKRFVWFYFQSLMKSDNRASCWQRYWSNYGSSSSWWVHISLCSSAKVFITCSNFNWLNACVYTCIWLILLNLAELWLVKKKINYSFSQKSSQWSLNLEYIIKLVVLSYLFFSIWRLIKLVVKTCLAILYIISLFFIWSFWKQDTWIQFFFFLGNFYCLTQSQHCCRSRYLLRNGRRLKWKKKLNGKHRNIILFSC